jgi:hypothetical protein
MPRHTDPRKQEAERKLPHHVDIPVPERSLGERLSEMIGWCRENVPSGQWAQHSHLERKHGEMPVDYARFYFATDENAARFRAAFTSA